MSVEKGKASWKLADERMESYVKWWFVQTFEDKTWVSRKVQPLEMKSFTLSKDIKAIAVRAIGLTGMAGDAVIGK